MRRLFPIETAPKDGRMIYLHHEDSDPGYVWGGGPFVWRDGRWFTRNGGLLGMAMVKSHPPTHWRPRLPAPLKTRR